LHTKKIYLKNVFFKKKSTFLQKKFISVEAAEVLQYPTHKGLTKSLLEYIDTCRVSIQFGTKHGRIWAGFVGFHETNSQPLRLLMSLCKIYPNVNKQLSKHTIFTK
jgi:hypothetical protein